AGNDFFPSGDFRRLPETIFFLPETSGGCRKRFFSFQRLPAVAGNDFFPSRDFPAALDGSDCVPFGTTCW
ncbi:MAG: hypothetical protein LBL62_06220, partial [Planctomycetaceae bacterium]|nr:hypothetical protein [Planctomycetaceae bacterium]